MGNEISVPTAIQSVIVPGSKKEGEGDIRRNALYPNQLVALSDPEVTTLYANFQKTAKKFPTHPFVGTRQQLPDGKVGPFVWKSYQQSSQIVDCLGSGFVHLGLVPGKDMMGLFAQNMEAWTLAAQACNAFNMTTVPLYDTLGQSAVTFIIKQASLPAIVVQKKHFTVLLNTAHECPSLRIIVQIEPMTAEEKEEAKKSGFAGTLIGLDELIELGKNHPSAHVPPKPEDLAIICYTSGTTGDPKGAMLTHANVIADMAGAVVTGFHLHSTDVHISYLPLAHMFERIVQEGCIHFGCSIGFYQGDVNKLFDDVLELKPTLFPSVPRLYNKLYQKVMAGVSNSGGLKKMLFEQAYSSKKEGLAQGYYTHAVWDALVFSKISARLGGRVRLMLTGSAPIGSEVLDFLRIAFSCPVLEGYGQTECGAAASLTALNDTRTGHVGAPLPCNEIKLVDVPEMDYKSTDQPYPRGEVCYRGPNVFKGYFLLPDKTKEALDDDGWLHSGDIGLWTEHGTLKIIDRKKNIFKLSQGEYIAAEKIENIYQKVPIIAQAFVYGDSLKSSLVAIIVPDLPTLKKAVEEKQVDTDTSNEGLCRSDKVRKFVLGELTRAGKEGFEQAKAIRLIPEAFSVENDLLTPTFKLKRPQAKKMYEQLIKEAYEEVPPGTGGN